MKKFVALLIAVLIIFSANITALAVVKAPTENTTTETIYFDDGSYIETILTIEESNISTFATKTVSGSKKIVFKNSDDVTQWSATLKGTYTYTGSSSTCTSSSIVYSISNDNWRITSATASKSGNKAIGNVTAKYYFLFVPTKTIEETITMTCSATGSLS